MPEKLISDLLDLPEKVRKGDFVLNLSKGVTEPDKTLEQYVVTPQLVACFDDALGFIRQAVESVNSKACYLHGSFGAGKSHFMAVLHLLLQHNPAVRNIAELAKLFDAHRKDNHGWVESKKFLLVPYHMIGARSMESAILGGYVDHVMAVHPTAPLPGVYLADEIFKNAQQHRTALGDDKFFEQLNQGQKGGGTGWGKLAKGWDAARFDAALEAPPMSEERSRLVGDLVQFIFPAFKGIAQGKDEAYVDLDVGLSVISVHAKALGYDGLILFLDELILWLASHAADIGFLQTEGNKLAKLVESRKAERPVPIISFVARQRDLRDLIGENVTGVEQLNFSDVLSHWEGRFHTITLEDRNLPVIAQKRVLKPRNDACRAELEESFEKTAQVRAEIMEVLLTRESDRTMFKMVYPFSPALIQALVAVSSALQRERTALKIMLQLLVNRRDTLRLGDVIPLGDLWDVVAHGDEAFTDVMRLNFENAKKLYQNKLLPMLEQQHEIDLEVDRGRAGDNPDVAEKLLRFENDDRLVKSLLLCALVHGVETLKNMTCVRLAALNHGTIRSRIPGREHQVVAQKLRTWAGVVGEIRVGDEPTNPTVSLQLSGVDTETIIESARTFDNIGTRQFKIRQMLFQSLGVPEQDDLFMSHSFVWRGGKRSCDLLFTNVRTLPDESLRSTDDWKLIIDFPFDTEGHSPVEDLDRLDKFKEKSERQRTLVWLPAFFSTRTQAELAKLVVIDRLLLGNNLEQHAKHLSMQDRETARLLLKNQQSALSQRLLQAVEAAYAIRSEPTPGTLDASFDMSESHFQSLYPTLVLQRPVGANLGEALLHLLDQALAHQFPKHPKFGQEVKLGKDLRQVLEVCQEAARTPDRRVFVEDKGVRLKLRNICNPLDLGQMSETHFVLDDNWKNHFNRMLAQSGQPHPTAADLRRWTDQPDDRGLQREVQNLLILVYADQTNRSFVRYGSNYTPGLDDLPNELELQEQTLPDLKDWSEAVSRVADVLGHAVSKLLNASNLAALAAKVGGSVAEFKADCESLPDRLQLVLRNLGVPEAEFGKCDRVKTARAVKTVLAAAENKEPTALVGTLARAKLETNATAMGKSLKSAKAVLECLRATRWDLFAAVAQIQDQRKTDADLLIRDVCGWLKADEHALAGGLAGKLSEAEGRAIKLLTPPRAVDPAPQLPPIAPPKPRPGWRPVGTGGKSRMGHDESIAEATAILRKLEGNPKLRLTIQWTLEEESP
ncbi:Uncharacterized protein OS=Singulisphaera acidiphila (strain ATCC BAA-1392 / DSM 18658 / VKM B-2454 / MOB10) GN=Sinac_1955 PE=4 SV=1 [Gemmataceae bacterium]|nr:Uncharacterized protein OS=Singulisphaera acidiphila (strain ATCC BAA-1392 / DSM 18658 / VKM B-2454 / MOB10) GN=Sinac_1955 PE=4 SV=1 [Gemmataceae bacterium]VTU01487.1 Uncharacterized protein OS=Singulisphaera acidiphila (strain ATCC BAA-1392 / DSM 18658 / VKM B-2454 / MOB10) GN=Sinac_1955 PE=4 SV=1 [Gemmataceae bacterium]